jgi:hypothetical protein
VRGRPHRSRDRSEMSRETGPGGDFGGECSGSGGGWARQGVVVRVVNGSRKGDGRSVGSLPICGK